MSASVIRDRDEPTASPGMVRYAAESQHRGVAGAGGIVDDRRQRIAARVRPAA
jgi:hypothetical protein